MTVAEFEAAIEGCMVDSGITRPMFANGIVSIDDSAEEVILRKLHPEALSIEPIDNSGCWSVLEEDGFCEYWNSYTFDNGKPRHLGTTTVEI